jgi:hypothetical protein
MAHSAMGTSKKIYKNQYKFNLAEKQLFKVLAVKSRQAYLLLSKIDTDGI